MKICSLYGAGFFYIPGTDTCLKIGGYLRSDHGFGNGGVANYFMNGAAGVVGSRETRADEDMYSFRARINMTSDFRTQSDYGTIRAYAAIIGQQSQAGEFRRGHRQRQRLGGHPARVHPVRRLHRRSRVLLRLHERRRLRLRGVDLGTQARALTVPTWSPTPWQLGNGFSASIDIEDGGNGHGGVGTGRGKTVINTSTAPRSHPAWL